MKIIETGFAWYLIRITGKHGFMKRNTHSDLRLGNVMGLHPQPPFVSRSPLGRINDFEKGTQKLKKINWSNYVTNRVWETLRKKSLGGFHQSSLGLNE